MKKSLIALAVAGAVSAPAFAATSNVDIYGVMNVAIQDTDANNSDLTVLDNTSRIGFKGTEDLGGGLKAVWQIESALGGNGAAMGGSTIAGRNTFIGLAGGFGTVLMGRHDTPYKLGTVSLDIFGDTIADYNLGRLNGVQLLNNTHDARDQQALAYVSPTWSGFHFAAAVVMGNAGGEGSSALVTNTKSIDATSVTGVYANGPLFLSASLQDAKNANSKARKLGAGYTFGDTKVGFVWEDINNAATDRDSWLLNVAHTMGPIVLKAQYGQADIGNVDQRQWALGVDYNLSKRTTVYAVYGNGDSDAAVAANVLTTSVGSAAGDVSGWNLGMKHSF